MPLSGKNPTVIKPQLNNAQNIEAWFSIKNMHITDPDALISGLNLGLYTAEDAAIVQQNRAILFGELGIDESQLAEARQVHGTRVQVVTEGGRYADTDALITQSPGLTLAIQVADCGAILIADAEEGVIAAVHAGWRGAVGGILENVINSMIGLGARPQRMLAYISPCISVTHFEVGTEVARQFPDDVIDTNSFAKPHVNLKAFINNELMEMGIVPKNIEVDNGCTVGDDQKFYSYRREGDKSGRMLGMIKITE